MDVLECPLKITYTRVTFINRSYFFAIVVTVSYRCRIVFGTRRSIIEAINWHICNCRWSCCLFWKLFRKTEMTLANRPAAACSQILLNVQQMPAVRAMHDPADWQWERRNDSGKAEDKHRHHDLPPCRQTIDWQSADLGRHTDRSSSSFFQSRRRRFAGIIRLPRLSATNLLPSSPFVPITFCIPIARVTVLYISDLLFSYKKRRVLSVSTDVTSALDREPLCARGP